MIGEAESNSVKDASTGQSPGIARTGKASAIARCLRRALFQTPYGILDKSIRSPHSPPKDEWQVVISRDSDGNLKSQFLQMNGDGALVTAARLGADTPDRMLGLAKRREPHGRWDHCQLGGTWHGHRSPRRACCFRYRPEPGEGPAQLRGDFFIFHDPALGMRT